MYCIWVSFDFWHMLWVEQGVTLDCDHGVFQVSVTKCRSVGLQTRMSQVFKRILPKYLTELICNKQWFVEFHGEKHSYTHNTFGYFIRVICCFHAMHYWLPLTAAIPAYCSSQCIAKKQLLSDRSDFIVLA